MEQTVAPPPDFAPFPAEESRRFLYSPAHSRKRHIDSHLSPDVCHRVWVWRSVKAYTGTWNYWNCCWVSVQFWYVADLSWSFDSLCLSPVWVTLHFTSLHNPELGFNKNGGFQQNCTQCTGLEHCADSHSQLQGPSFFWTEEFFSFYFRVSDRNVKTGSLITAWE